MPRTKLSLVHVNDIMIISVQHSSVSWWCTIATVSLCAKIMSLTEQKLIQYNNTVTVGIVILAGMHVLTIQCIPLTTMYKLHLAGNQKEMPIMHLAVHYFEIFTLN